MKFINKVHYRIFCWINNICPVHMQPLMVDPKVCLTCISIATDDKTDYEKRVESIKKNLSIARKLRSSF